MPEQEVEQDASGHYQVRFRPPVEAEDWNAQISLMTGMAAADLMIGAKVGILRTMPAPDDGAVDRFRRASAALGVQWPADQAYGEFLRTLDRTNPAHLALIHEATSLFRGAGYTPFDGQVPAQPDHAAVAAAYAHVTAPLRRLVDRFGLVVCEAISAGQPIPAWAREALPSLPQIMAGLGPGGERGGAGLRRRGRGRGAAASGGGDVRRHGRGGARPDGVRWCSCRSPPSWPRPRASASWAPG